MTAPFRLAYQIRHYRDLSEIAKEQADANLILRSEYLDLARSWAALAERLENAPRHDAVLIAPQRNTDPRLRRRA